MMAEGNRGFKFRLQNILDVKRKQEESAKEKFALALAEKHLKEEKFEAIEREREGARKGMIREIENGSTMLSLTIPYLWTLRLVEEGKRAKMEAMKAAQEVERRKDEFLSISKEVDLLESLRQKHLESYIEEDRRDGIKILDDIASTRFRRREGSDEGDKLD
jgi:flagellar FliJ protein